MTFNKLSTLFFPIPNIRGALLAVRTMAKVNNCRLYDYQDGVKRFPVPEDKVSWSVDWPEYQPVDHTNPHVLKGPVWADLDFRYVQGQGVGCS